MRQAGVLAAAGIVALTEHVQRLQEDHEKARLLATGLSEIAEISIDPLTVQTNMVFVDIDKETVRELVPVLSESGIKVHAGYNMLRLVTHHDVEFDDLPPVISAFKKFFSRRRAA